MKSLKPVAGVVLIFLLGAASGSLTTYTYFCPAANGHHDGKSRDREGAIIKQLTERLNLDSQQQASIGVIIGETHEKIRQVKQKMHPEIEALLNDSQHKISQLLRPDQQEKFNKIVEERRAHHKLEHR